MPPTNEQIQAEFSKHFTNRQLTPEDIKNAKTYGLGIFKASADKLRQQAQVSESGRSLEGTLDDTQRTLDQVAETSPADPSPRSLSPTESGVERFKRVLRDVSLSARATQRPTVDEELGAFREGGVALTDPTAISAALDKGTLSRSEVETAKFSGVVDLLKSQEERLKQQQKANLQFAQTMLSKVTDDPQLLSALSGEDIESLKSGQASPELIQKITDAAAAPERFDRLVESRLPVEQVGEEYFSQLDEQYGVPSGTHKYMYEERLKGDSEDWIYKEDAAKNPFRVNLQTGTYEPLYPTPSKWDGIIPEGTRLLSENFTNPDGSPMPFQCGELVNAMTGSTVGSSLEEKMSRMDARITSENAQVGDTIVLGGSFGSTGHVAVINEIVTNPETGKPDRFRVSEANKDGRGTVTHKGLYSFNDPNIKGFIDTELTQQFRTGTDGTWTAKPEEVVGGGLENLSVQQQLEAKSLAVDIFGKRAGTKSENVNSVAQLMLQGQSADEIRDNLRFSAQSPEFTGTFRDAAENIAVAGKMSEQRRESFFDNLDRNLEAGNLDKALETIKIAAVSSFPAAEQSQIRGKDRTVQFLLEVKDDLKRLDAAGIDTNIFNGTTEKIAGKIGEVKDPELRALATKVQTAIQQYRRSMSGVAFSVPESKEYEALFPNINKSFEYNEVVLDALLGTFVGDLDFSFGSVMGAGTYSELFVGGASSAAAGSNGEESTRQSYVVPSSNVTDADIDEAMADGWAVQQNADGTISFTKF